MTQDIEAIARGLTKAQREALMKAELDRGIGRYFSRFISISAGKGLIKARLGTAVWSGVMINDRGLAVRDHLQGQDQ
jgi:hypothetical protein